MGAAQASAEQGASTAAPGPPVAPPRSHRGSTGWGQGQGAFPTPVVLLVGVMMVIVGQVRFVDAPGSGLGFGLWLTGLVMLVLALRRDDSAATLEPGMLVPRTGWRSAPTVVPALVAAGTCVVAWRTQHRAGAESTGRWSIAVWAVGVVAVLVAAWQPRWQAGAGTARARLGAWWTRRRRLLLALAGLTALGALATLVQLGSNPWAFNGDEGGFARLSAEAMRGRLGNPFGVGYWAHPVLFNELQGLGMSVAGRSAPGARLVPALLGACAVPVAFVLVRRLTGSPWAGLTAALLLATFHVHLFWSRSALPNGASELFVLSALLLLDLAIVRRDPLSFVAVGVCVGLAQYFYFSNRVLVPVIAVALVVATVPRQRGVRRWIVAARALLGRVVLIAAGFIVSVAPLAAFYDVHPEQFNARVDLVSVFHGDWLETAAASSGRSVPGLLWFHLSSAIMLPFRTPPAGFYRPGVPFVGWPLAVPVAIGLALVTARSLQPRWCALSAAYWATVVGVAFTTGPVDTNRWVMAGPLFCVFAAVGVYAVTRPVARHLPSLRTSLAVVTAAWVVSASAWSLHRFFHDANQVAVSSDANTQVAEHLGREVVSTDPRATVYFSGVPRMSYAGFANLVFRTPDVTAVDVLEPWTPSQSPPALVGTTIFAAVPDRAAELDVVATWFPAATRHTTVDDDGNVLYTSLTVHPEASS